MTNIIPNWQTLRYVSQFWDSSPCLGICVIIFDRMDTITFIAANRWLPPPSPQTRWCSPRDITLSRAVYYPSLMPDPGAKTREKKILEHGDFWSLEFFNCPPLLLLWQILVRGPGRKNFVVGPTNLNSPSPP